MKRTIFLPMALALLLASCGSEGPQSVADKALVDANLVSYDLRSYSAATKESFDLSLALGSDYEVKEDLSVTRGAVVLESVGEQRIYSLYVGGLIGTSFAGNYAVYQSSIAGFYVYYESDASSHIYDGLGNELYEGNPLLSLSFTEGYANRQHEVRIIGTSASGELVDMTYCYVPSEEGEMVPVEVGWTLTQFPSDSSVAYDLSPYGLEGLALVNNGSGDCYVIDGSGNIQSSFALPKYPYGQSERQYMTGGRLVGQVSIPLLEDASDYSYFVNGTKYELIGYRIDLLSGAIDYFEPDYLIVTLAEGSMGGPAINDAEGEPNLSRATVYKISGQRALTSEVNVLLDCDGGIAYELTGNITPWGFAKMGNGSYFNVDTKSLYDENLILTHDLSGLSATYLPGPDAILLESGTMEALLSPDGDFLIPFAEQAIVTPSNAEDLVYCLGNETLVSYEVAYEEGVYSLSQPTLLKNLTESYSYALAASGPYGLYSLIGRSEAGIIASLDVYFKNDLLDSRTGILSIETTYKDPYLGRGYVRMDVDEGTGEGTKTFLYRFEA